MHARSGKLLRGCAALLVLAAVPSVLPAQMQDGPPNVLVVQREYLKPGKGGMLHERSESAFVHAFAAAKYPTHYFALDSMSGPSRALFMIGYNSFADWEKDNTATQANKALGAALDQATLKDGDLLTGYDTMAAVLRPDLSLGRDSINGTRFFDIATFVVKPGHSHDFEEAAHMYADALRKIAPDAHWDCFEVIYGSPAPTFPAGSVYVVITLMKSLAEVDKSVTDMKNFAGAMGEDGMKKFSELSAAGVEAETDNLFQINPRMSYPPQEWIDQEPAFWKVAPQPPARHPAAKQEQP